MYDINLKNAITQVKSVYPFKINELKLTINLFQFEIKIRSADAECSKINIILFWT